MGVARKYRPNSAPTCTTARDFLVGGVNCYVVIYTIFILRGYSFPRVDIPSTFPTYRIPARRARQLLIKWPIGPHRNNPNPDLGQRSMRCTVTALAQDREAKQAPLS